MVISASTTWDYIVQSGHAAFPGLLLNSGAFLLKRKISYLSFVTFFRPCFGWAMLQGNTWKSHFLLVLSPHPLPYSNPPFLDMLQEPQFLHRNYHNWLLTLKNHNLPLSKERQIFHCSSDIRNQTNAIFFLFYHVHEKENRRIY